MPSISSIIHAAIFFLGAAILTALSTSLCAQEAGANALEWFHTRQKESGAEAAEKEFIEDTMAELNGWIDHVDATDKAGAKKWFAEFKASPALWLKLDALVKQKLLLPDSTDPQALLRAAVYLHINEPTSNAADVYFDKVAALPKLEDKHQRVLVEYYMAKKFGVLLGLLPTIKNEIVLPLAPEIARILMLQPSSPPVIPFVEQMLGAVADPAISKKGVPLTLILPRCFMLLAHNQTGVGDRKIGELARMCLKLMEENDVMGDAVFTILFSSPTLLTPEQRESFAWKCLQNEPSPGGLERPLYSSLVPTRFPSALVLPEIPEFYLLKRARLKQTLPDFWKRIEKLPHFEKGSVKHGKLTQLAQLCSAKSREFPEMLKEFWDSQLRVAENGAELSSADRTLSLLCEAAAAQRRFVDVWKLFWDSPIRRFASGSDMVIAASWRILELQAEAEGYDAARKSLQLFTDDCLGPANSLSLTDGTALEKLNRRCDSYIAFWWASGEMPSRVLPFFDLCERGVLTRAFPSRISVHIPTKGISLPPVAGGWTSIRPILAQSRMFGDVNDFSMQSIGYYQSESLYLKVVEWVQRNAEFAKTIKVSPDAKFGEKLFVSLVNPAGGISVADVVNQERANIAKWEMYQIKCLASMLVALMDRSPELAPSAAKLEWLLPWARMEQAAQLMRMLQVASEADWKGFLALQKNSMANSLELLSRVDPDRFWKVLDVVERWSSGNTPASSEYTLSYLLRHVWSALKNAQAPHQPTPELLRTRDSRLRCWKLLTTARSTEFAPSQSDGSLFSLYWAASRRQNGAEISVDWTALLDEMGEALSPQTQLLFLDELMSFELEVGSKLGANQALSIERLSTLEASKFSNKGAKTLARMLANGLRRYRGWWAPMSRPSSSSILADFFDTSRTNGEGAPIPLTLNNRDEELEWLLSMVPTNSAVARLNALRTVSKLVGPNSNPSLLAETSKSILATMNQPNSGYQQQDAKFRGVRSFAAFLTVASDQQRQVLHETATLWADEIYNAPPQQAGYANSQYTDILLEILFQLKDVERIKSVLGRSTVLASWRTFLQLHVQGELALAVDYWKKNFVNLHQNLKAIHAPSDSLGAKFRANREGGNAVVTDALSGPEKVAFEEDLYYMAQTLPAPHVDAAKPEPAFSESTFAEWWASIQSLPADWKLVLLERTVLKSRFREYFPQEIVKVFLKEYTLPTPSKIPAGNQFSSYDLNRKTLTGLPRMREQVEIALARSLAAAADWDLLLRRAAKSFASASAYNQPQIDQIISKRGNSMGGGFGRSNPSNPSLSGGNVIIAEFQWWAAVMQSALLEWPKMQPVQKLALYEFLWDTIADPKLLAAFDPYQKLEANDPFGALRSRHGLRTNDSGLTNSYQIEDSTRLLFLLLLDLWDEQPGRTQKRCLKLPAERLDPIRTAMQDAFWDLGVVRLGEELAKLTHAPKLSDLAIPATRLRFSVMGDSPVQEREFAGYTLLMAVRELRERDKGRWGFSSQEYVNFLNQVIPDCRQSPELATFVLWALDQNEPAVLQSAKQQLRQMQTTAERPADFWIRLEMACRTRDEAWAKELLTTARELVNRPAKQEPSILPSPKLPSAGFPPNGIPRPGMNAGGGRDSGKLTGDSLSGSFPTWTKFNGSSQNNFRSIATELNRLGLISEVDGKKEAARACYVLAAKYFWASRRSSESDPNVILDLTEIDFLFTTAETMGGESPVALPGKRTLHDPALSRMALAPADFQEQPLDLGSPQLKWSEATKEAQWIPFADEDSLRQPVPKLIYQQTVNFDPSATTEIRYLSSYFGGEIRLYINGLLTPFLQPTDPRDRVGIRRSGVMDGLYFFSVPISAFRPGRNEIVWVHQPLPYRISAGQTKRGSVRWLGYKIPPEVLIKDLEISKFLPLLPKNMSQTLPPILPLMPK